MAHLASVSVSKSLTCRSIHEPRGTPDQPSAETVQDVRDGFLYSDRWSFLQKLMAIEDEHDRRRADWDRRNKERESPTEKPANIDLVVPDLLSRWLRHQVLDDGPEEAVYESEDHLVNLNSHHRQAQQPLSPKISVQNICDGHGTSEIYRISPALTASRGGSSIASYDGTVPPIPPSSYLPTIQGENFSSNRPTRKRQLRLPPILLPRIYTVAPRPLQSREFLTPTKIRGPISDEEWEDLKDCRYIRHAVPRFSLHVSSSNLSVQH